jgi:DNA-binding transcriptional LysR family regulator
VVERENDHVPVREPEISELRAFCLAAQFGSIGEAARAMHMSQPAMSKRLRTLETVAGTELLVRSPRGVTLTPTGEQLYSAAQRVLSSADTVNELIQSPASSASRTSVAKLGCSPTVAEQRLPQLLAEMSDTHTGLSVEVLTANSWVVRTLVNEGRMEVGVVAADSMTPSSDDLHEHDLWSDEVVVAVPFGHPWELNYEVDVEDFLQTGMIERDPWAHSSRLVTVALEQAGYPARANPRVQLGSTDAILLTANQLGVPALVSIESIPEGFFVRRVAGIRFERKLSMVWSGALAGLSRPAQLLSERLVELGEL